MSLNIIPLPSGVFFSNQEVLKIYYDFSVDSSSSGIFYDSSYRGRVENRSNSGLMQGAVYDVTGDITSSQTNYKNNYIPNGEANTKLSNVITTGLEGFKFNDFSSLIIFENSGEYHDGIIFGSLEKEDSYLDGNLYRNYKGLNFGITKRGHLFFQYGDNNGVKVCIANEIELANKNIVSFSVGGGSVSISRYDLFNQEIQLQNFPAFTNQILDSSSFYLGGSDFYWRSTGEFDKTFSGSIDSLLIFSGRQPEQKLFGVVSGLLGNYFYNSGSIDSFNQVTGTELIPLYGTGITGYLIGQTGSINIPTGLIISGVVSESGIFSQQEGSRYLASFNDHIEEIGLLNNSFYGVYSPTGESAHATLGLQSGLITGMQYSYSEEETVLYYSEPLYGITGILTGYTKDVTGYEISYQSGTFYTTGESFSGVNISGNSEKYKKNFAYFIGDYYV